MTRKLVQGLLTVAALVLPAGSALAYCTEYETMPCMCPDGTISYRFCIDNDHFGSCQCGGLPDEGASGPDDEQVTEASDTTVEPALVCVEAPAPAETPANTRT